MIHSRANRGKQGLWCIAVAASLAVAGLSAKPQAAGAAPAPTTMRSVASTPLITGGIDEKAGNVRLLVNKSVTLTTSRPYKRISVGQPDIAEVNGIGPTRILVTAKKAGTTQIIVWDEDDNSQTVDVLVQANLLALRSLYERLMPDAKIDVIDNEGTIALTGTVPNVISSDQAVQLASGYGNKVLNMLEVSGGQQVQLQVRFAEVSKTATNALGVNLGFIDSRGSFGASTIGLNAFTLKDVQGLSQFAELAPGADITQFGRAFVGNTAIDGFVSALRQNNLLRVLAEPNLTAVSGQEADFLAGGEFPIPIVQGGNDSGTSITVEFKPFGVRLLFTPVVLGEGKVRLKIAPEVSDVDFTFAVNAQGFRIPGTRTRRMSTTVEMTEGQTLAIAGLLDNRVASNKDVTPLLGDLPVIGALFRSVRYQRSETELVVMVTPRLVRALNPGEVPPLPGENWRHPTEADLYLNQDGGGPIDDAKLRKMPVRPFIGTYGFVPADGSEIK